MNQDKNKEHKQERPVDDIEAEASGAAALSEIAVIENAPAYGMASLMINTSMIAAQDMAAASRASQHLDLLSRATTSQCVATILGVKPARVRAFEDALNAAEGY